ncbi:MAG: tail fiber domain-containing protein, partial [Paraclostridium sp.]
FEVACDTRVSGMGTHSNGNTYFWHGGKETSQKSYTMSISDNNILAENRRSFYATRGSLSGGFNDGIQNDYAGFRSVTDGILQNRYNAQFSMEDVITSGAGFGLKAQFGLLRPSAEQGDWGVVYLSSIVNRDLGTIKTWGFDMRSGDFISPGNVVAYSDEKLKENIKIIPDALEKIQSLNGYTYTRKDTGLEQTGLIAQEVQKVLPQAVTSSKGVEEKEETLGVSYGNMVGLLVEGIKEQQKQIEELKKRIEALEVM